MPDVSVDRSVEAQDEAGRELRLPGDVHVQRDDAAAAAAARQCRAVRVEKGGEHLSLEADPEPIGEVQLRSTARARGEAEGVLGAGAVARQTQNAGEKRPRAVPDAELLETAGLPGVRRLE